MICNEFYTFKSLKVSLTLNGLSMLCNKNEHGKMKHAVFVFVYQILILIFFFFFFFVYLVGYILHIFIQYVQ